MRKRAPQVDGVELVKAMAVQAVAAGSAEAQNFAYLLEAATSEPSFSRDDRVATEPLSDWLATPLHVVNAALEMALKSGDADAIRNVVWFGADMISRWPDYLEARRRYEPQAPS